MKSAALWTPAFPHVGLSLPEAPAPGTGGPAHAECVQVCPALCTQLVGTFVKVVEDRAELHLQGFFRAALMA
ncbi:hypothetical protein GCM10009544_03640 [Streptomyces stramineus]|uniref:Uncharacterized protein n=1 Tax=Streptomyces stramineus TaxID=173861 RepID=A0ABN0ZDC3_9ACTN